MKRYLSRLVFFLLAGIALTFTACDSDGGGDDEGVGPPENITRLEITLATSGGAPVGTFTASDDGNGFQAETISLMSGVSYVGMIEVFDDTILSASDRNITGEISDEQDAHRFFFSYAADEGDAGRVMAVATDLDNNNQPVGLEFQLAVTQGGVAAGNLTVVLSHFGAQPKSSSPGGLTDVEVTFPIIVQ